MKTLLHSKHVWDIVGNGNVEPNTSCNLKDDEKKVKKEEMKKDALAFFTSNHNWMELYIQGFFVSAAEEALYTLKLA